MSKVAHIVAIAVRSLGDLGFGISPNPDDVAHILGEGQVWIGPRQVLETDFDFVQPIPYIVISRGDEVLAYTRTPKGGDERLHAKVSIGFGGHVDLGDAVVDSMGIVDLRKTMENAIVRELEEELGVSLAGMMPEQRAAVCRWTHVISSDASPVDEVHVGLVAKIDVADLPGIDIDKFEDAIGNARFVLPETLRLEAFDGRINLETWTTLVLGA